MSQIHHHLRKYLKPCEEMLDNYGVVNRWTTTGGKHMKLCYQVNGHVYSETVAFSPTENMNGNKNMMRRIEKQLQQLGMQPLPATKKEPAEEPKVIPTTNVHITVNNRGMLQFTLPHSFLVEHKLVDLRWSLVNGSRKFGIAFKPNVGNKAALPRGGIRAFCRFSRSNVPFKYRQHQLTRGERIEMLMKLENGTLRSLDDFPERLLKDGHDYVSSGSPALRAENFAQNVTMPTHQTKPNGGTPAPVKVSSADDIKSEGATVRAMVDDWIDRAVAAGVQPVLSIENNRLKIKIEVRKYEEL